MVKDALESVYIHIYK